MSDLTLRELLDIEAAAWDEYHAKKDVEYGEQLDKLKKFLYTHKEVDVWSVDAKGAAIELRALDKEAVEKILPDIRKIIGDRALEILEEGYPV